VTVETVRPLPDEFIRDALQNRHNQAILERMPELGLPDAWLVAGCLFQTIWNLRSGQPPEAQIKDYDLFYFDPADLSEAARSSASMNGRRLLCGPGHRGGSQKPGRVHTWYEDTFGFPYPALQFADGIDRFLVSCTCVGLKSGHSRAGSFMRRTAWTSCTGENSAPTRCATTCRCLRKKCQGLPGSLELAAGYPSESSLTGPGRGNGRSQLFKEKRLAL
jgi:hypothetical protein